jgi:hypothetical protein
MSDYTIRAVSHVHDIFAGQYPGAMRFMTEPLQARQVALTRRLMPPHSGGRGSYGHRHNTQEEIYSVVSGTLQFKLEHDVIDVAARPPAPPPARTSPYPRGAPPSTGTWHHLPLCEQQSSSSLTA